MLPYPFSIDKKVPFEEIHQEISDEIINGNYIKVIQLMENITERNALFSIRHFLIELFINKELFTFGNREAAFRFWQFHYEAIKSIHNHSNDVNYLISDIRRLFSGYRYQSSIWFISDKIRESLYQLVGNEEDEDIYLKIIAYSKAISYNPNVMLKMGSLLQNILIGEFTKNKITGTIVANVLAYLSVLDFDNYWHTMDLLNSHSDNFSKEFGEAYIPMRALSNTVTINFITNPQLYYNIRNITSLIEECRNKLQNLSYYDNKLIALIDEVNDFRIGIDNAFNNGYFNTLE
jgi:hypothetical protein